MLFFPTLLIQVGDMSNVIGEKVGFMRMHDYVCITDVVTTKVNMPN